MGNSKNDETQTTENLLKEISRSVNLLVKLKVRDSQGDRKLNEMILLLHSLGCRPKEIGDFLGKRSNDINPVLSRARKGSGKINRRTKR